MNHNVIDGAFTYTEDDRAARCRPESVDALKRIAKLIDSSSFGTDMAAELSRRAPDNDVVAVCAAADEHEATGPRFPRVPAEIRNIPAVAGLADGAGAAELDDLAAVAATGDARALERLLAAIHAFVLRYCRARLGRHETALGSAEDVAQEVCIAVIRALPTYRSAQLSFVAFVYGIAAHKVTDAFRANVRDRSDLVEHIPDGPSAEAGPEQRALATAMAGQMRDILERLDPRQRDVLVLRVAVGLSASETASAMGSTPAAVRLAQHRALNRLRDLLTDPESAPRLASREPIQIDRNKWWHDETRHRYIDGS